MIGITLFDGGKALKALRYLVFVIVSAGLLQQAFATPKRPHYIPKNAQATVLVFENRNFVKEPYTKGIIMPLIFGRDKTHKLSHGVRIRDTRNRLIRASKLIGERHWSFVQFNKKGEIHRIWLVTEEDAEIFEKEAREAEKAARKAKREAVREKLDEMSDEERQALREKWKERREEWRENLSDEDRQALQNARERWERQKYEQLQNMSDKQREALKERVEERLEGVSEEDRTALKEKWDAWLEKQKRNEAAGN